MDNNSSKNRGPGIPNPHGFVTLDERKEEKIAAFHERFTRLDNCAYVLQYKTTPMNFSITATVGQQAVIEHNFPGDEATLTAVTHVRSLCVVAEESYYQPGKRVFLVDVCDLLVESVNDAKVEALIKDAVEKYEALLDKTILTHEHKHANGETAATPLTAKQNLSNYWYAHYMHTNLHKRKKTENIAQPYTLYDAHFTLLELYEACEYVDVLILKRDMALRAEARSAHS